MVDGSEAVRAETLMGRTIHFAGDEILDVERDGEFDVLGMLESSHRTVREWTGERYIPAESWDERSPVA